MQIFGIDHLWLNSQVINVSEIKVIKYHFSLKCQNNKKHTELKFRLSVTLNSRKLNLNLIMFISYWSGASLYDFNHQESFPSFCIRNSWDRTVTSSAKVSAKNIMIRKSLKSTLAVRRNKSCGLQKNLLKNISVQKKMSK